MLQIEGNGFEIGNDRKDIAQSCVNRFSFGSAESGVKNLLLEFFVKFKNLIESECFIKSLAELVPTCLNGHHQIAEQTMEKMIHGVSEDVAGMEKCSHFLSPCFSHLSSLVS